MAGSTASVDIKRERRDLYSGRVGRFDLVELPPMRFLMVDGHGDPDTAPAYRAAVEALYSTSYSVRALARSELGRVHTVGPLEGLWFADDLRVFTAREKDAWRWTMMIWQPEWITEAMVATGLEKATTTRSPAAGELVRFEVFNEGHALQTLHVGAYDEEGPVIARMHEELIPAHGASPSGHHHEIYLSDPRRTEPAKLKTILRQPVAIAGGQEPDA